MAGSLAGAFLGDMSIPAEWKGRLELKEMMLEWIDKLYKLREF